jgi:hypothetical protein
VPDRTGHAFGQLSRQDDDATPLTDSSLRIQNVKHLGRLVVLALQPVTFVTNDEADRWNASFDTLSTTGKGRISDRSNA